MVRKAELEKNKSLRQIPSIDELCRSVIGKELVEKYGRPLFVSTARRFLTRLKKGTSSEQIKNEVGNILPELRSLMKAESVSKIRKVLNLTGTVLHTNLGRAILSIEAIEEVSRVMSGAMNLEYDLEKGTRGDRDDLVEEWLARLTGAEAVTVVNNNAAAVFLALSTFGYRKEVLVSRGELVEIGGEFRIPDIMKRAGAKLFEVGTTNRTHLSDFRSAVSKKTGAIMKIHASNYEITGFTSSASERELADLAKESGVPFIVDLGSGTLVDLGRYGLPREPTVKESLENGTDIVTFSGDKLLGGPQCGVLAGRKDLIAKIKKNSLKRIVRVDKMTLAALDATLRLYANPGALAEKLPTLKSLVRSNADIRELVEEVEPALKNALEGLAKTEVVECKSQIGSGALPIDSLPSWGVSILPLGTSNRHLQLLNDMFRKLPIPIIGRLSKGALIFDFRCLDEPKLMLEQFKHIGIRKE